MAAPTLTFAPSLAARWRPAADRVGLIVLLVTGVVVGVGWATSGSVPVDALHYWNASGGGPIYGSVWGADAGSYFVYPPPFVQVLGVLHALGWPLFIATWTMAMFAALWGSTRWWSLPVVVVSAAFTLTFGWTHALASPLVYAFVGNIQSVIAVAIIVGFRWPAAWAFVLLTKIGPGVGVLWFAFRGEWRNLAIALGSTAAIAAVSFALYPSAWADFARFATGNAGAASPVPVIPIPFVIRAAMSVALIAWGAKADRRWTVPIAAGWSAIALYEWSALTIWLAALPLATQPAKQAA